MDSERHSGRVVVVTGAGSGIGRATALRMAREGAHVVGCDVNGEGLAATEKDITAAGFASTMIAADITKQEDADRVIGEAERLHGRVDVLANVAGIMDWFLPAHEVDDETWNRVLAVNLTGPMMLCRRVLPGMKERRRGAIVNVGSIGGLGGGAAGAAYTASKHGLTGLTRSIAWTYRAEGIRCNIVCPGGVQTNIGTTSVPRSEWGLERLSAFHGLSVRMADPDDIASLISWLVSDEAINVSGAEIAADAGWTAS